jgi:ribosomal protein S18 acetylase RimI-like enzyme
VDVSSGVERVRGVKDPTLIRSFIAAARSGIRFRSAAPADAEALGQAHVSAWREAYPGLVPDAVLAALDPLERAAMWRQALAQGAAVHLAERDGRIVGFISCGAQRDTSLPCQGEILAIYVLQAAQRQGVGRALMGFAARDLLRRGHGSALLWVMEGNTAARQFYRELNGREIARREQAREGHSATGIAYAWDDVAALL